MKTRSTNMAKQHRPNQPADVSTAAVHDDTQPVLSLDNVTIAYRQRGEWLEAVRDVSFCINAGQTYGLVGESGSGKSTLALAVMRYLSENGTVRRGTICLRGQDLLTLSDNEMRRVWSRQMKLVPQNALSSLNPSLRIGEQVTECLRTIAGERLSPDRVPDLLRLVRLSDPERIAASYPHELSGGMQQRVMIAMALSAEPELLVLDEPTTSLDVTTEAAILDLVDELIHQRDTSVLFVSHNLGVIARVCDRVAVLYAGELVEDAAVDDLYARPLHPYTQGLLNSVTRLGQTKQTSRLYPIPGSIPHLEEVPTGCVFAPRCPIALDRCFDERPDLDEPVPGHRVRCHRWPEILAGEVDLVAATRSAAEAGEDEGAPTTDLALATHGNGATKPVLILDGLKKQFVLSRSLGEILGRVTPRKIRAVHGVDLTIGHGRTLGLVGESGSGKTTLARCVIGLTELSGGEIKLLDMPLAPTLNERDRDVLHQLQMVFQNPDEALNPYLTVAETLRRPLLRLADYKEEEIGDRIYRLLEMVKLRPEYASRLPAQLSGGEKQRVAIARAFAAQPELLIFDESVSALDVSVQASILNLLNELQQEQQSAYLFITHDLGVVSYLADDLAVIYLGQLMEVGQAKGFFEPPYHPYTEALLSAIPVADPQEQRPRIRLEGEVPSPIDVPTGCPFHTRCPRFLGDICVEQTPPWREGKNGHRVFCHIPLDELAAAQERVVPEEG